ncbi:S-adenosyl-L-methionine-dependent methyltransferase [Lepidopterella palustris CBS 459.81]|uniref:S-adenosyl-L-methionine-dependent methyltransferase n=1 Tax=Lepidopterella palustris CBS 459.81 TaxID=1314670 RepID=A0A8E2JB05_9PEZI|nr:S-adenosyl-L-methionine-dependent methyltransferase [Lepidopterella palustris CBS 459.81]
MSSQQNSDWSATQYLKFGSERTRSVRDLLSQVPLSSPKHIIDLGCGPGNSTKVLAARYPNAQIMGMDSSPDMLEKARASLPGVRFVQADLSTYSPDSPVDLLFSNAVFHWLRNEERIQVMTRLIKTLPSGGVFAIQVPDNFYEPSHTLMRETAKFGPWSSILSNLKPELDPMPSPQVFYDSLKPLCKSVDIWHTHYHHILESPAAIVEWVKGTGLRPFIDPLDSEMKRGFLNSYLERITEAYPSLEDRRVMLTYPRLFLVAVRA